MPAVTRPFAQRPTRRGSKPTDHTSPHAAFKLKLAAGEWLQKLRRDSGLTQQQVATLLDLPSKGGGSVSAFEVGRGSVPPERYRPLADLYGVDPEVFGRVMLRYSNPWAYALIYGDGEKQLRDDLAALPTRSGHGAGKPTVR